jgi:hypothetical protein
MCRFSIRDVLWLTALVAMGVAWWLDHWHASKERLAGAERQAACEAQIANLKADLAFQVRLTEMYRVGEYGSNLLHHLPDPDGL